MQYHIYMEIDRQVDAIVQCVYKVKVVAMAMRERGVGTGREGAMEAGVQQKPQVGARLKGAV